MNEKAQRDPRDLLATWGVAADHDPRQSIRHAARGDVESTVSGEHAATIEARLVAPEPLSPASWAPLEEGLELRATLGEGGMGLVHLGVQKSLLRKVAVKTLKPSHRSTEALHKLVAEARITGALEHPNIVPVHDIATDAEGHPQIVLKRIEGEPWSRLIARPEELKARFGADDVLAFHLGVLMQVCNAVAFAHQKRVLHRDLKPDNVMVGEFGEVYVVDWGIAVRQPGSTLELGVPDVRSIAEMAGTPSHMAPEMIDGDGARISERTDVYLLGATLSEVLTGQPPHRGTHLLAVLAQVRASEPVALPDVAAELRDIVHRAMHVDPEQRFPSVKALRDAVKDHLAHRSSIALADAARARLSELDVALSAESPDRARIDALFAEGRFGLQLALEGWPENAEAARALKEATAKMIERALAAGEGREAERLLGETEGSPELTRRVREARARERRGRDELERLRKSLDPKVGVRWRLVLSVVVGLVWTIGPMAGVLSPTGYGHDWTGLVLGPAALLTLMVGIAVARPALLTSILNRQLVGAGVLTAVAELTVHLGGALGGLSPAQTQAIALVGFGIVSGAMALMLARELALPAVGYLLAFVVALRFPDQRFLAQSLGNLVFTLTAVVVWVRGRHPLALAEQ